MDDSVTEQKKVAAWPLRFSAGLFRLSMKLVLVGLFVAFGLFVGGFLKFASTVSASSKDTSIATADGIVVLTGGKARIARGLDLLEMKKGNRLLISGVNPSTSVATLRSYNKQHADLFDCCVDVESVALDTIGNASEAKHWIKGHQYSSLILVTSDYHMPRSLLEFRRAMPTAKIVPFPVAYAGLKDDEWWTNPMTLRFMLEEYAKYLGSATRDFIAADTITALRASMVAS